MILRGLSNTRVAFLLAGVGCALVAATGLVADRVFAEPDATKYVVTVAGPTGLALLALVKDPFRWLTAAVIVSAPVAYVSTISSVAVTPLTVLLVPTLFLAASRAAAPRVGFAALGACLACGLVVPGLVQSEHTQAYLLWIGLTLATGWVAYVAAREDGGLRFVTLTVVVSAALQGALAVWEFKSGHRLNLYSASGSVVSGGDYFYNFGTATRSSGTLPDPIGLGNVLALVTPLALCLTLAERRFWVRLGLGTAVLLCAVGLVTSFSRMSWIGAAAGTLIALALLPRALRWTGLVATVGLVAVVVVAGLQLGGDELRSRFDSIANPTSRQVSTGTGDRYREQVWRAAIRVARQRPVDGTGFGRLGPQLAQQGVAVPGGSHAHNSYLQMLGEGGLLGLLALVLPMLAGAWNARAAFSRHRVLCASVAGGLVATAVAWTTDVEVQYSQVSTMIAVLLGLAAAAAGTAREVATISVADLGRRFRVVPASGAQFPSGRQGA